MTDGTVSVTCPAAARQLHVTVTAARTTSAELGAATAPNRAPTDESDGPNTRF